MFIQINIKRVIDWQYSLCLLFSIIQKIFAIIIKIKPNGSFFTIKTYPNKLIIENNQEIELRNLALIFYF